MMFLFQRNNTLYEYKRAILEIFADYHYHRTGDYPLQTNHAFLGRFIRSVDYLYTGQTPDDLSVRKAKDETQHSRHHHYGRSYFMLPRSFGVGSMAGCNKPAKHQAIIAPFEEAAAVIKAKTGYNVLGGDSLSFIISSLPRIGQTLMGGISSFAVNMFVLVFVLYFMLMGGKKMERYVNELLPFNEANTQDVVHEINMIVRSNAIGIPLLAIIQGGVAMIGYWIFGAPNILFSGFLTGFASVVPMVGTALIWVPIAIYMALIGNWFQAIGLAIFGALVISQLDNLIRFIIQKKMADIHPLITIFGVVIGLSLFGFMGVIFGPLLLSLFFLFVNMFKKGYLDGER